MSPPPVMGASPEDLALVARLLAGEEAAFELLVAQQQRAMFAIAGMFVRNPRVAEEVVQEAWVAVLTGLHRFEGRSSLRTWICRIVSNRAKSRGAREARSVPFSALGDEDGDPGIDPARFDGRGMWIVPPRPWTLDSAEAVVSRAQLVARIEQIIEQIPPRQRAVLVLRDIDGLDSAEVCAMLDLSEVNQRVLLHRARTAVRAALEPELEQKR